VRSAIFSIIGNEAVIGKRVLDLYAGTGVMGIEALSRGAIWAEFVERNIGRCRAIKALLGQFSLELSARVIQSDVNRAWSTLEGGYDLVFVDPPYDSDEIREIGDGIRMPRLIAEGGLLVFEYRAGADPIELSGRFTHVTARKYGDTAITLVRAGAADA